MLVSSSNAKEMEKMFISTSSAQHRQWNRKLEYPRGDVAHLFVICVIGLPRFLTAGPRLFIILLINKSLGNTK